jgi:hypothetical protein
MTLILGMNLGSYVLLAADTRVSWYPPGQPMQYHDEREKIRRTRMGIMTGMGLVNLLDSVKERFDEEDPLHTDRLRQIIVEERDALPPGWMQSPRVKQAVEHETCWMFSYVGADDLDNATPESVRLRLALSHPHDEYQLRIYPPNSGGMGFPVGVTEDLADEIQQALNDALQPLENFSNFETNLRHHVGVAAFMIRVVAKINDTVSPTFQIGVHRLDAGIAVSEICTDGGFSLHFEH